MSSIEVNRADGLASALFDELVTPLSGSWAGRADRRRFCRDFDAGAETYFEPCRTLAAAKTSYEFPGAGRIDGLLEALASFWVDRGETDLATMKPRLLEIALALEEESEEAGGEVDIFCYTMF